jgi:hypothetical protein
MGERQDFCFGMMAVAGRWKQSVGGWWDKTWFFLYKEERQDFNKIIWSRLPN